MNRTLLVVALAFPSLAAAIDVKGKVVDAQTGEAIVRARVTGTMGIQAPLVANPGPFGSRGQRTVETREATVLTDTDGNFVFHNADGGFLGFSAQRVGYVHDSGSPLARFQVQPDQAPAPITLRLTREAVLKGRLTDEHDQPLSGQVALYYEQREPAAKRQLRVIYVNHSGEFRFNNLEAGRYFLKVSNATNDASWVLGKAYPPRFYPDRADLESARAFTLGPGHEENVEFTVAALTAHQIRGRFESSEGPGIYLLAGNGESTPVSSRVEVDENTQTFTISGVPAGVYILSASWRDGAGVLIVNSTVKLTVEDADVTGIVLTPEPTK